MQENNKEYEEYLYAIENRINKQKEKPQKTLPTVQKKKRKTRLNVKAVALAVLSVLSVIVLIVALSFGIKSCNKTKQTDESIVLNADTSGKAEKDKVKYENLVPKYQNAEIITDAEITGKSIIFVDDDKNEVVASREATVRMYPASTTKIMTLLVAVENIKDYNDTFTMTYEITDPLYKEGATVAGFLSGEVVNMYDLIYGTILPSGGDASISLAQKIAGSEEEFVVLMNKKAKELKLKDTHFTNCTGLYNENHYCTAEDLSVILRAAMRNDICRKVLSTYKYTTSKTAQHSEGIELENTLFKYMYGTEPEGATILGGKTGFVNESGYCIASFGESDSGKTFVCVALASASRWPAVYDQIKLYTKYAK